MAKEKKYEIIKNGMDDYTLKYRDKEYNFHSTAGIVKELQDTTKKARMKMIMDLAKEGKTIRDLVIETKVGGKTIQDHSNKDFIEEGYVQQEQTEIFNKAIIDMFGISLEELVLDIGLNEDEVEEFGSDLGKYMVGTPRG